MDIYCGRFTKIQHFNESSLLKETRQRTYFDKLLMSTMCGNSPSESVLKYYKELLSVGINVAYVKEIKEINDHCFQIIQSYVTGMNLRNWLSKTALKYQNINDPVGSKKIIALFRTLVEWQYKLVQLNSKAYIDYNLDNFVITNISGKYQAVYVDITPPLYMDRFPRISSKFSIIEQLYTSIETQQIAFLGYWMRTIINSKSFQINLIRNRISEHFFQLLEVLRDVWGEYLSSLTDIFLFSRTKEEKYQKDPFYERLYVISKFSSKDISGEELIKKINSFSLRASIDEFNKEHETEGD